MFTNNIDSINEPSVDLSQDLLFGVEEKASELSKNQVAKREVTVLAKTKRRVPTSLRKFTAETSTQTLQSRPKFHTEDRRLLYRIGSNIELADVLMEYGKNPEGIPAIQKAIIERDYYSIEVLIKAGARVSAETKELVSSIRDCKISEILEKTSPFATPGKYHYSMTKKPYMFSTEYEIDSEEIDLGFVQKKMFSAQSTYRLGDAKGFQAEGVVRLFSLGTIFTWAKDMDIYDDQKQLIGGIDGIALTTADARYNILDAHENVIAVAFLDDDKTGFSIVDPQNYANVFARLKRDYTSDVADPWSVTVYQGHVIDPRVLKIFTAFAVDTESSFKRDN